MEETQNEVSQAVETKKEETPQKGSFTKTIFWVIVGILIILVAAQIINADKYKATVLPIEGERKVGVNPTTEVLDFGDLSPETSASRTVTLKSEGSNSYIWIVKFGSLADLIKVNDSRFVLKGDQQKQVEFSVFMPSSAPIGQRLNGYVWIFKMPKLI